MWRLNAALSLLQFSEATKIAGGRRSFLLKQGSIGDASNYGDLDQEIGRVQHHFHGRSGRLVRREELGVLLVIGRGFRSLFSDVNEDAIGI